MIVNTKKPSVILVMGVSGCGKTTVGKSLAKRLKGSFLDADDLHPAANIKKLSRGEPLNDEDRWPWLDAVADSTQSHVEPHPLVLACSALKEFYRDRLQLGESPIIFLNGPREIIEDRLSSRCGHFMSSKLLDSQLEILEAPQNAINILINESPDRIVDQIVRALR